MSVFLSVESTIEPERKSFKIFQIFPITEVYLVLKWVISGCFIKTLMAGLALKKHQEGKNGIYLLFGIENEQNSFTSNNVMNQNKKIEQLRQIRYVQYYCALEISEQTQYTSPLKWCRVYCAHLAIPSISINEYGVIFVIRNTFLTTHTKMFIFLLSLFLLFYI
ncbi:hypothetical protein FF38_13481 [Lucilia cuprina]|uniref:Uncharacterized protein n=1 Tax=Lucilia cuprina TaxID=7375 RepID=A0A0L0BR84_LUCCU|nr:hypothetical protein FF38_13481 [Lucilia cuprina]